ncbi:F0F1 ATP synthase subunit epsilon [Williamsoniiplasma somnilux]|uniref:F0F1 ATP synthase subunit epsilon n=1 Tax=Williamsoniiplasma somnilux TaxID=215578 RepID=A0A2K8P202_9MOLU|nr:ATP synthase F1 subunit epsilon [Williamsoniiplasma somnilux]ATZ19041.1 F0F1 ATP synthase subunit epsilon [Williamsoniiplasma somnilux]
MSIKLKIVTPDGTFINDKEVDIVNVQTIDGDIGIMGNMIPLVSSLKIGILSFREKGNLTRVHVNLGIVKVDGIQCKVITESLYLVDEAGNELPTPQKLF